MFPFMMFDVLFVRVLELDHGSFGIRPGSRLGPVGARLPRGQLNQRSAVCFGS